MPTSARPFLAIAITILTLAGLFSEAAANRADGSLRDTFYFSPSWGYSVRWFNDEWSVVSESSQNLVDSLSLENPSGATVRFEGRPAYLGDARACLDDQLAVLEAEGATDIAVLQDDAARPLKIYHPWRSWMLLIAAVPTDIGVSDQAIYLDCRTLRLDDAVFIRELRVPAADFDSDLAALDILNAALPRGAWFGGAFVPLEAPGLDLDWATPPLPTDSILPWELPDAPRPMDGPNGEVGMFTTVDKDPESEAFVVVIENTGTDALSIDPAQFLISNDPTLEQVDPDVPALSATWTDGAAPGARSIPPGDSASLLLHFPPPTETVSLTRLVYWDASVESGGIPLACVDKCGYGGGGSRPRVRAVR